MNQPVEDLRIFERFSAKFPVKLKDSRNDFGTDIFLRDASAQGARLVTHERFFIHDNLSLEVKLPDGHDPLVLNGEVVWAQKKNPSMWDIGLKFHKIQLMNLQRLYKFVLED